MLLNKSKIVLSMIVLLSQASLSVSADDLSDLPSGKYKLELSHASIVWKVSHMGLSTYVGRFTDFSSELILDTHDISKSSVNVIIKTDSLATAYPWVELEDFDKKLSESWFKSTEFPIIRFISKSVDELEPNKLSIGGELTMLGLTKSITLTGTMNKAIASHIFSKKPVIGFSARTTIDRTLWGVSKYAPNIVGAEVKIEIEGEFEYKD